MFRSMPWQAQVEPVAAVIPSHVQGTASVPGKWSHKKDLHGEECAHSEHLELNFASQNLFFPQS